MDVRIGIAQSSQVIEVSLAEDTDRDAIKEQVEKVLSKADRVGVLWLTDRKGKELVVPVDKVAFVELGTSVASQRIGFGA
jgi:hypothetical protein